MHYPCYCYHSSVVTLVLHSLTHSSRADNEVIRDLLTPGPEQLDLREDPLKGPTVSGITELEVESLADVMGTWVGVGGWV
jgi:hypothetical protein